MYNGVKVFKIVNIVLLLIHSGCMSIKDTSGIKQYLQDQGRAEILAVVIKDEIPNPDSPLYEEAKKKYTRAAGAGNGWMNGIVLDAKTKREVDVSIEDYKNDDAGKYITEFLSMEDEIFHQGIQRYSIAELTANILGSTTTAILMPFVEKILDKIIEQNENQYEQAIKAIEEQFSKAQWTTFELTTSQWINNKYKE